MDANPKLETAIAQLSEDDLWTGEKLRALFRLGKSYEVEIAIDRKRRDFAREKVTKWLKREMPVQDLYRSEAYREFGAMMTDVDELLTEYEDARHRVRQLRNSVADFHECSQEDREVISRFAEISETLQARGIILERWATLSNILTDFEVAMCVTNMTKVPIGSIDNEILEPTAAYIASNSIHHSYLTRFFVLGFLDRLKSEVAPWSKIIEFMKKYFVWLVIASVLIAKFGGGWIISEASGSWLTTLAILLLTGLFGYKLFIKNRAIRILDRLVTDFKRRGEPSVIDGRALKGELDRLEELGLRIPSLLFSLFDLAIPGNDCYALRGRDA